MLVITGKAFIPSGLQLLFPVSPVQLGLALGDDPVPQKGGCSIQSILGPFILGKVVLFIEFSVTHEPWARLFATALWSPSCLFHTKCWTDLSIHVFSVMNLLGNVLTCRGNCLGAFGFILAVATGASPAWGFLALDWKEYILRSLL